MLNGKKAIIGLSLVTGMTILGCQNVDESRPMNSESQPAVKPVVYQVFTRLFGNKQSQNRPWGTLDENGVGKFNDFTPKALQGIKELGVTHIWYTGVPHHGVIGDYREFGIGLDDPDVIKGRAGSPYAVKDYYNVNPDLAVNPANRLDEFEALIERTHNQGMKVIIDIVPNHVARNYQSISRPDGIEDFGAQDDTSVEYARDNNFYYVVGESFKVPQWLGGYQPLGGEPHPLADGQFEEHPAKWTGNGSTAAQPHFNDWYETVKVNYGVRPDGSYDFDRLPKEFAEKDYQAHHAFWQGKSVPNSWLKFENIVHYWLDKGVDGFRYDMAEMVPVEFWSYLNSSIKMKNPDAFLLAEVYNPKLYRDYIHMGKMDYLYDKVGFYDRLRDVMQRGASTDPVEVAQSEVADIESHMLHFLENHDEQRIASLGFAGHSKWGMPAMVVSALISRSPTMIYFGQEVGEDGSEEPGFGDPTRTSIFDYIGVPAHQRWMNDGAFDGGQLSKEEKQLREYYRKVLTLSAEHPAMSGESVSLHSVNRWAGQGYTDKHFAFARVLGEESLVVISSFIPDNESTLDLLLPSAVAKTMALSEEFTFEDALTGAQFGGIIDEQGAKIRVTLDPLQSLILQVKHD